jgi:hypothetical protein
VTGKRTIFFQNPSRIIFIKTKIKIKNPSGRYQIREMFATGREPLQKTEKRGDQTFLSSLFFPRARLTRKAYYYATWGEPK